MELPGRLGVGALPGGRRLDYWDGGDPHGAPVLFMPGTPSCRWQGAHSHEAALTSRHRVVSISRPGYGESNPSPPGLASVGQDAVDLAEALGLDRYAVLGVSGGGPYAVATALAGGHRVTSLGVIAGIGPWAELDAPDGSTELERELLDRAAAGDVDGALAGFREDLAREVGPLLELDDVSMVDAFLETLVAGDNEWLGRSSHAVWAADLREGLRSYEGYARDNVSWGRDWDIDPAGIQVPTHLWYGGDDRAVPPAHGQWLADQIPGATLIVRPGQNHVRVCFGFWAETFTALMR